MNKKYFLFAVLSLLLASSFGLAQGGGMWIPNELNEKEMKSMGMEISAAAIFDSNNKSIKDAIAHFGGGCTSEVISPKGLLLTNHHCGYGQIQAHSSVENDYLSNGFWAENIKGELPNKGLTATFIVDIKEVTDKVLNEIPNQLKEEERELLIQSNIQKLIQSIEKESYQEIMVKPYFKGNKYYQIITETYKDVRLVGAPPSSIGKYGSDTDNWVWPRHTGDFALFRIYADKDNKPAEYDKNNLPYIPKHYLPVSLKGIKEDDFTMVYGFPGSTDEYLPASALEQIQYVINPARISTREVATNILDKKMRTDDKTRIKYASKFARLANAYKKWKGENLGLKKSDAINNRKAYESEFNKRIKKDKKLRKEYGNLLNDLDKAYKTQEKYALAQTYFNEVFNNNSETFRIAQMLNNLINVKESTEYNMNKEWVKNNLIRLYKDYDAELDKEASKSLIELYLKNVPADLLLADKERFSSQNIEVAFRNSIITGNKKVNNVLLTEQTELAFADDNLFIQTLIEDDLLSLISEIQKTHQEKVTPYYTINQQTINQLMRTYMKAQLEVFTDKNLFPDANSTLRVTYGKVDGYAPRDAVKYDAVTYLDGVIEKYIPGDYEFDLPKKLLQLYEKKDYGIYADNGKLPVNFIATNHTTGGNSGSPALDKHGNLIGINFDRVWEGTMSDLNYDPEICRNIMVDMRYILFIIDKYANAGHLLKEMSIIKD